MFRHSDTPPADIYLRTAQIAALDRLRREREEMNCEVAESWSINRIELGDWPNHFAHTIHAKLHYSRKGEMGGMNSEEWLMDSEGMVLAHHDSGEAQSD